MKEATSIQQYVVNKLLEDKKLSTNSLLDAIFKVCSYDQFYSILSIIIESSTCEETSDLVKVKIYVSEEVTIDSKLEAIRIIKKNYGFGLKEAKDYIDSCIGKHSTLPRDLKLEEARKLVDILGYFGIDVTIIKNY